MSVRLGHIGNIDKIYIYIYNWSYSVCAYIPSGQSIIPD